ncbi:MAG: hypothetical protein ACO3YN_18540, partial [Rubrivivax sp.]
MSRVIQKPLAVLSRRDNHPSAATTGSHPGCRAARIQIVAPQSNHHLRFLAADGLVQTDPATLAEDDRLAVVRAY